MAVALEELLVSINADTQNAERGLDRVRRAMNDAAGDAAKMGDSMKSSGEKGASSFSALSGHLKGALY